MIKIARALLVLGAALVALGPLSSPASAYPDTTCNVTVRAQVLKAGTELLATGTAAAGSGSATTWTVTFDGTSRSGSGNDFSVRFATRPVTKVTRLPLVATVTGGGTTCRRTIDVTLLPNGTTVDPPTGGLPNTGGPRLILLVLGLALASSGCVLVVRSRRGEH